ncbi:MAG: LacI family DNA-binding transcriptional regulator [Verrucomicrobiae bacterium]|nr:LacI family DNA-binding transcriptional regulator [Verrucomicrobiae bacterium]
MADFIRMTSLKDIAREAGVSTRTVTRVLKNNGYVHKETRQQIEAAIQKLGYHPNRAARSLRTRQSYEITVITSSVEELHVAKLIGLEEKLRQNDYQLNLLFHHSHADNASHETLFSEIMKQRPAGAVVLLSYSEADLTLTRFFNGQSLPYVIIDSHAPDVDTVRINRAQGVCEATLYLAGKGHRKIAFLGPKDLALSANRLEGYHRALAQLGRSPEYLSVDFPGNADERHNLLREFGRSMKNRKDLPDAIIAYSDRVALPFLAGLLDAGIKVPDQIALVGFDNFMATDYCWPRLTTIAQPTHDTGVAAAEIILQKIAGLPPPAQGWSRSLPTRLIIRESA